MGRKGFYLSIDSLIAAGIAVLMLITLSVMLVNYEMPTLTDLANYKVVESGAYSLKGGEELDHITSLIDSGNETLARAYAISVLDSMDMPGNVRMDLELFSSVMAPTQTFSASTGQLKGGVFAVSIPFTTNSTSKFGVLTIRMGEIK